MAVSRLFIRRVSMSTPDVAKNTREKVYDEQLLQIYSRRSKNLQGRKFEFIQKNYKTSGKDFAVITGTGVLSGAVAGGTIGAIVGGTCGTPGGPPGIVTGAVVGGSIGAVVGGALGVGVASVYVYPDYKAWLKTEEGRQFGGELRAFLGGYDEFNYLCGINHDIVIDAVRTPQGQIYERKDITQWVTEHGTDPMTLLPLTLAELKDDNEATLRSTKQLALLIEEDMPYLKAHAKDLIPGLESLNRDLQKRCNDCFYADLHKLNVEFVGNKITPKEYRQKRVEIENNYRF